MVDDMTWWYTQDREIALDPEIASDVLIQMSDPRSRHFATMRHETLPPDHLFGRRLEVLTLAVLSQLRAQGQLAPDRARVDLRGRPGDRAGARGGRVLRPRGRRRRGVTVDRGRPSRRERRLAPARASSA